MSETDQTQGNGGVQPDDSKFPEGATMQRRFRPGFAWGLAAGALAVVLIAVAGVTVMQIVAVRAFRTAPEGPPPVVVSPTKAGRQWFSVRPDGTGMLQGWTAGDSGAGETPAPGVVGYFDVGTVDTVEGVKIVHTTHVYFTRRTRIFIGGRAYQKGKARSPAEAIFNEDEGIPNSEVLSERLLTIRFHRVGKVLVADSISAPLEATGSPVQE